MENKELHTYIIQQQNKLQLLDHNISLFKQIGREKEVVNLLLDRAEIVRIIQSYHNINQTSNKNLENSLFKIQKDVVTSFEAFKFSMLDFLKSAREFLTTAISEPSDSITQKFQEYKKPKPNDYDYYLAEYAIKTKHGIYVTNFENDESGIYQKLVNKAVLSRNLKI